MWGGHAPRLLNFETDHSRLSVQERRATGPVRTLGLAYDTCSFACHFLRISAASEAKCRVRSLRSLPSLGPRQKLIECGMLAAGQRRPGSSTERARS